MNYIKLKTTALRLITKFGADATLIDLSGTEYAIKAVKVPTGSGSSSNTNDGYSVNSDETQAVSKSRVLVASSITIPKIFEDFMITAGNDRYRVVVADCVSPDFSTKIFYDCICFEN